MWCAGVLLARFMEARHSDECARGARVLDVGAGLGAVGATLAALGAEAVLTDGEPACVEALSHSLLENKLADKAIARHLDWNLAWPGKNLSNATSEASVEQRNAHENVNRELWRPFDFVVAAEVLYDGSQVLDDFWSGLVSTLANACDQNTRVYLAYVKHTSVTQVFFEQAENFFDIHMEELRPELLDRWPDCVELPVFEQGRVLNSDHRGGQILIYRLSLKSVSSECKQATGQVRITSFYDIES